MRGTIIQTDIRQISPRPVQISCGYLTLRASVKEAVRRANDAPGLAEPPEEPDT